jgi:hypothetical protein
LIQWKSIYLRPPRERTNGSGVNFEQPINGCCSEVTMLKRSFDASTTKAISQTLDGRPVLSMIQGFSQQLSRQMCNANLSKFLLPKGFNTPPGLAEPACERCRFWHRVSCGIEFTALQIDSPGFVRDSSLLAVEAC